MHSSTHDCAAVLRPGLEGAAGGLPPWGARSPSLFTSTQRAALLAVVLAAHGALGWGLLQLEHVRAAVADVPPMLVDWIGSRTEDSPTLPAPPQRPTPPPRPVAKPAEPPAPLPPAPPLSTAPAPQPAPYVVEPVATRPAPAAPTPVVVEAAPAPEPTMREPEPFPAPPAPPAQPTPPAPPRELPDSAVQYLEPPVLEYPRAARRAGESGRVLLRVYIDESGAPRQVRVNQSSGFVRLDGAALAAVHKARFKPYVENGRAIAGWALIPLVFDLEK